MAVKLGPFTLEHPFILAPMAGITHSCFRRLMRRMSCSLVVSELISANGIHYAGEKTQNLLAFHPEEKPVGLQIFGEEILHLCEAAKLVESRGASFVDLNLGCPVTKVVKKGAGAAMCRNLPKLFKVLKALVESVNIPVTIKIRTGWDDSSLNAHEIVQLACDAGITWVAIHGRTRAQGYSGLADWDYIANVKAKAKLPIIGNGDLSTAYKAFEYYKKYGVDAVLIGRGALRNPFIFKQASNYYFNTPVFEPELDDYINLITTMRSLLEEHYSPTLSLLHSRKFLAWFAAGIPGCHEFRKQIFLSTETLWTEAFEFFSKNAALKNQSYLSEPFLMGGHG